jgi:hypothetical protein
MSFLGTLIGGGAGFLLGGPTGAMLGASLGGGLDASDAASQAASTQADAANRAADLQYKQWRESVDLQKPWLEAGQNALAKLTAASDYTPFGMSQFQADPGYAFRVSEGQKALDRQAAARGGLISGAALKAATRFGGDMASQEYTNAFNRYQTERAARLQPLQSLAGVGQTTANQIGQSGQTMASNVGEAYQGAANARASGYVGGANAMSGALGTGLNFLQGQNYVNALRPSAASYRYPGNDPLSFLG